VIGFDIPSFSVEFASFCQYAFVVSLLLFSASVGHTNRFSKIVF
jgi:hypothetical protein